MGKNPCNRFDNRCNQRALWIFPELSFPSDQPQLFPSLFEGAQDPIQLLFGMGRHITCPEQFSSRRHRRADDGINKNAVFEEELAHLVDFHTIFDDDGDHGRFTDARIIPHLFIALEHFVSILPELCSQLGLLFDDVQSGADGGDQGRWKAGAEDHRAANVLDEIDYLS